MTLHNTAILHISIFSLAGFCVNPHTTAMYHTIAYGGLSNSNGISKLLFVLQSLVIIFIIVLPAYIRIGLLVKERNRKEPEVRFFPPNTQKEQARKVSMVHRL